ncbi:MAG: hypothetical protein WAV01_02035 [Candidatus Saccharimonadales bacterium]
MTKQFYALSAKSIHGCEVSWNNTGGVHFSRIFHDMLPEDMQGQSFNCKNLREFEKLCQLFTALISYEMTKS